MRSRVCVICCHRVANVLTIFGMGHVTGKHRYKLVKEALHERKTFLEIAPHLSSHLPIMLPIYQCVLSPIQVLQIARIKVETHTLLTRTDGGKCRTIGSVARCMTCLRARRIWSHHTTCQRVKHWHTSRCSSPTILSAL